MMWLTQAKVLRLVRDADAATPEARAAAAELKAVGSRAVPHVCRILLRAKPCDQPVPARALILLNSLDSVDALIAALNIQNAELRAEAAGTLGYLTDPRATGPLIRSLQDPDSRVRNRAAAALGM